MPCLLIRSICPVCNGLAPMEAACPRCSAQAEDAGRLGDYYGPYSPYRPIDDIRMSNGYPDVDDRVCPHTAYCAACRETFVAWIQEIERL